MESCKACDCKIKDGNYEQNVYDDMFCSVCWDIKERYPMKSNDEVIELKSCYMEESDIAENHFKTVTLIIIALIVVAIIMSLVKENSNDQRSKPQSHERIER